MRRRSACRPSRSGAASPWVEFDLPGGGCLAITTVTPNQPSASAGGTIAFEVEDLPALVADLKAKGVAFAVEGIESPVCHMAIVKDPDGNAIILHKLKSGDVTRVAEALAALEAAGEARVRDGMARYGIVAARAFGVSVGNIRQLAKKIGRDHALADELWRTGWYEARLLAAFVDDPRLVTPEQMDRWVADCENWADCDTICFHLFDKTPHAFAKVDQWAADEREFVRRAAFALLASWPCTTRSAATNRSSSACR